MLFIDTLTSRYTNPIIRCSLLKAVLKHCGDGLNHQSILITSIMIAIMQNLRVTNSMSLSTFSSQSSVYIGYQARVGTIHLLHVFSPVVCN